MAGILVFGALSYSLMGISQLPDVDFPVVTVTITWPGASPDVMESAVADIVEDAVMSVDGIQLVQSASQQGQTQIIIQFALEQNINAALLQIQTKVSQAQKNLPETIDPPVITKTNPNDQPILWAAAYQENGKLRDLSLFARDELKNKLTTVPGVGDISLGGYVDPQMRIWMDADKMRAAELTSDDIVGAVNLGHKLTPTGYQDKGAKESYIRVQSEFTDAAGCNSLMIPKRGGETVWTKIRLGDVAHCEEGTDEIRRIARFNGIQPTIGMGVIKQHGTNAVAIGDAVRKRIHQLGEILPSGMKLGIANDSTVFIRDSIKELLFTLGMAVLLTALVCYLFLGSLSSAFNVILAIPVSLVGSFIVIHALGFTVNTFTLMALSLSIGIVVDDAIMVLENITRHNEEGEPRALAALLGAREITGAATAATLAILAIFLPVVFMKGIVGKFFFQFGITLSVTVMLSLLEALTLAPMRCSQFLSVGKENAVTRRVNKGMQWLSGAYHRGLKHALNHRGKIITVSILLFAFSLITVKFLRKEFIPPQDQSRFLVTIHTKMGSSLEATDKVFREAEKFLKSRSEVESYFVSVGGFGGGLVNQGISFVNLKERGKRGKNDPFKSAPSQQEFMAYARKELSKIPGVENVAILDLSLSGFSAQRGYPIEFVLQGPDWDTLTKVSSDLRTKLAQLKVMADIDSDYNPNMPETTIVPDRAKAAARGVPISVITDAISAMVGGQRLLPNKYTDKAGHRDDIQVKMIPRQNEQATDITRINVRNINNEVMPLVEVVTVMPTTTLLTITRYNRERGISIYGNFPPGTSQSDVLERIQKEAKETLPKGYHLTLSGSSQAFNDSFSSLAIALVLGIFVAYLVLASQFNSFLHPVVILLSLPFSITGALWAMKITDTSLNVYSIIGILLLMGIVKKNAILLVEFTNQKRAEGKNVTEALLEACPIRLRPILMTSFACVAGAIPEAFAHGSGAEVIRPMAIALIGGVLLSTFLTLFVVPCAYSLFSRFEGHKHEKELDEALGALKQIERKAQADDLAATGPAAARDGANLDERAVGGIAAAAGAAGVMVARALDVIGGPGLARASRVEPAAGEGRSSSE